MSKTVVISITYDYDRDYINDLMDVTQVRQIWTNLSHDEAHEQVEFLWKDDAWRESFTEAVVGALTGAPAYFRSDQN